VIISLTEYLRNLTDALGLDETPVKIGPVAVELGDV
jgi:hypothetical protein